MHHPSAQESAPATATTPVRAAHRIDRAGLECYLGEHVPEAVPIRAIGQFAAGQSNPTYLIEGPAKRFVLRKKPPGTLLPSAHLVEREYRILSSAGGDRRAGAAGPPPLRGS